MNTHKNSPAIGCRKFRASIWIYPDAKSIWMHSLLTHPEHLGTSRYFEAITSCGIMSQHYPPARRCIVSMSGRGQKLGAYGSLSRGPWEISDMKSTLSRPEHTMSPREGYAIRNMQEKPCENCTITRSRSASAPHRARGPTDYHLSTK